MKILAISYLFPNSVYPNYGIFVLNRLKALQKNCEIKVINPLPWFPFSSRFSRYGKFHNIPKLEIIEGIEVYHPRFPIIPKYFKLFDAISYSLVVVPLALKIRREFAYELIDLHWTYPDLPSGCVLSSITGKPFLTTLRGHEAFYIQESMVPRRAVQHLLKKSAVIIALSQKLRDVAIARGCTKERIAVIRNGVDQSKFNLLPLGVAKKYLNLPPDERIILAVGSLIQGKGIDRIISALGEVIKKHPDVRLYLVGSEGAAGFYKSKLIEQISDLHLEKYITFAGEVDNADLIYWYNAADLFCLASRREGSPNVLTEALCSGCPAVATDVGSVTEIMSEKHLGFVIPNQDDILEGLLLGVEACFDRQHIARSMVKYDWGWCAQQVLSVYQRVLNEEIN